MMNLADTKIQLKKMIPEQGIAPTIKALKELLPEKSKRFEDVLLIESRQNEANKNRLRNVMDNRELQIVYNKIREDLLELIDSIEEADFDTSAKSSKFTETQKAKKGSILHRIPSSMQLNKETRCVVRIALDDETIIENIDLDENVKLQSIRVSDIMQVEMLDSADPHNFAIRTISSAEQFIDEDDYTEWLFYVKPLNAGAHPLMLKVSVIELIHGKERKREIVLEEVIEIVTAEVQEDEAAAFKPADVSLTLQAGAEEAATVAGKKKAAGGVMRKMAFSLVVLTVMGGAVMAFAPHEFNWITTRLKNTIEAYNKYLMNYPESRHSEKAVWQITELNDKPEVYRAYLDEFPTGRYKETAIEALEKLELSVWQQILDDPAIAILRDYKAWFPEGAHIEDVESKLEDIDSAQVNEVIETLETVETVEPLVSDTLEENPEIEEIPAISSTPEELESEEVEKVTPEGMVLVQAGEYTMGQSDAHIGCRGCTKNEKPAHEVTLNNYYIDQYEVSNTQYAAFLNAYGSDKVKSGPYAGQTMVYPFKWGLKKSGSEWLPQSGYEQHPIGGVTWYGASEYAKYYDKRLPTEAEWEYAARGGNPSNNSTYTGGNNIEAVGWHAENSGEKAQPIGAKAANELGLYDMSGNVWEWCADWYGENYYRDCPGVNPRGPSNGSSRVLRGGSWLSVVEYCRVTNRSGLEPGRGSVNYGFRCAKSY